MKESDNGANILQIKNVSKTFEDGKKAVKNISLNIKKGEFVTLLGPSGCGKTTTLRMIAGFEMPDDDGGQILFNGEDITRMPPHKRALNTVFQRYALFPHLNVFKNVAFGLKMKFIPDGETTDKKGNVVQKFRKYTKEEIEEKVNKSLKMVDLEDYGHRNVNSLSGGQMQRVAIARALVNEPEILLLDEPLAGIDPIAVGEIRTLVSQLKNRGLGVLITDHNVRETLDIIDRAYILHGGTVLMEGTPDEIVANEEVRKVYLGDNFSL